MLQIPKWSTPAEHGTTTTDMSLKHLDLQAQEAVVSHQWKKKMDFTTDDDHGILRLNNSCRVHSVNKTQRKKKVVRKWMSCILQISEEKNIECNESSKKWKLVYKRLYTFAMSA